MRPVENYLLTTLDGGARVVTEPLPSVRSVALGIWIGAGGLAGPAVGVGAGG